MADHEKIATSLLVLKEYAKDPDRTYAEVAEAIGKAESVVIGVVEDYVSVYLSQEKEPDFPTSLIAQYKDRSGNDLSLEDFEGLMPVVDNFRQGSEEDDGPQKVGTRTRPKSENFKRMSATKADSRMSSSRNNRYDNSSGGSQTTQDTPDLSTNASLLQWVLEKTPRANSQPKAIMNFMEMFELQETQFIREPQRLLQALIFGFGELPGQSAFSNFMNLRPQFVYDANPSSTVYGQAGMAGMGLGGTGMGMGGIGMNYGQQNANPLLNNPQYQQLMLEEQMEDIRDRREERKDNSIARRMQMQQLNNMMQSQTPMNPNTMMGGAGGQMAFKEVLDKDGKAVSREWSPRPPGSSSGGDTDMSKMMFQAYLDSNKSNKEMMTNMFTNWNKNNNLTDVIKTFKEVKDFGNDLFGDRRGGTETPETLALRLETTEKVLDRKLEMRKLQHEWQREREDRISSQETMKGWFDGISGVVNGATQTILPEFMRGVGMAAGQHRAAQQTQMGGQQQQAAAQYQQQQAQYQQQQYQMRQQQMAAAQAAQAQAGNPNAYMPFDPNPNPRPAVQQQQRQQPDRVMEVMRQHQISDQDFFDASDEDLEQMARQFEHGVRQLGSMHNRIDEERSRRRHTRHRQQAKEVIREREYEKIARESEAAERTRVIAAAQPPAPEVQQPQREFVPAEPVPEPVRAAAQPQVERPPQSIPKREPEPIHEQEEESTDAGLPDDDGEDVGDESDEVDEGTESTET